VTAAGEARARELQEAQQQHQERLEMARAQRQEEEKVQAMKESQMQQQLEQQQLVQRSLLSQQQQCQSLERLCPEHDLQQRQGSKQLGQQQQQGGVGGEMQLLPQQQQHPQQQQAQAVTNHNQPEAAASMHPAVEAAQSMQAVDLGLHALLGRNPSTPIQIFCTNLSLPPAPSPSNAREEASSSLTPSLQANPQSLSAPCDIPDALPAPPVHPSDDSALPVQPPSPSPSFYHQGDPPTSLTSGNVVQQQHLEPQQLQHQQQQQQQQQQESPSHEEQQQEPTSEQLAHELAALILQACKVDSTLLQQPPEQAPLTHTLEQQQQQQQQRQQQHATVLPVTPLPRSAQLATHHHSHTMPLMRAHPPFQPLPPPAFLAGSGLPPRPPPLVPILPAGLGVCVCVYNAFHIQGIK